MISRTPLPFEEALQSRAARTILPTDFRTRLLAEIPPQLRERSFFSAGVTNADFLEEAHSSITELVSGTTDRATKRAGLKDLLDKLSYKPFQGEEGTITDLSSDRRLNLILDTGVQQVAGFGGWEQGQGPAILDQWPAQELIDTNPGATENRRKWADIWAEKGGQFFDGRMIALVDDPIWEAISFFGQPYPPFALNSYWDVKKINRDEAMELKLIDRDTQIAPQSRNLNTGLQATPTVGPQMQQALLESLSENGIQAHFVGDVLKYLGGAAA